MKSFVDNKFVKAFVKKHPNPLSELGQFVYLRTYSRFLPNLNRREHWHETVQRAVNYNMNLAYNHLKKIGFDVDVDEMKKEAQQTFTNIALTKQFPSGRTLWVGGAENGVAEKFPTANFNCSFTNIETFEDLCELFYMLMIGTGVGFKSTKKMAAAMPPVRSKVSLIISEYNPLPKDQRLEHTEMVTLDNGYAKIYVGDSKEGWVESLRKYFEIISKEEYQYIHTVKISFNSVRPYGERLKTFGGTASGPEPLMDMFRGIDKVFKNKIDPSLDDLKLAYVKNDEHGSHEYYQVRPIHILDIGNLIGANVVIGGVRRTAEIFLFDSDDYESMFAKYGINGIWDKEKHEEVIDSLKEMGLYGVAEKLSKLKLFDSNAKPLFHRRLSNNSIAFEKKPSKALMKLIFKMLLFEGEPAFVNMEEMRRRRPDADGVNPCVEIILSSKGVCNLTTVDITKFVKDGSIDIIGLLAAQRISARIGVRMTLVELELESWNKKQKRDRLVGTSLTGVRDAFDSCKTENGNIKIHYENNSHEEKNVLTEKQLLKMLRETANEEAEKYAFELRIPKPLLVTTVKPEGTLSQVAGGVSSGLHYSHAPFYIRRIRAASNDAVALVAKELGWNIHAEVGTMGFNDLHNLSRKEVIDQAKTVVIDFYIKSGSNKTKDDVTALKQLDGYFEFQSEYTDHNSSNTITVKPHEWDSVRDKIFEKWDDFVGVSFLSHDGGSYLLAPYEEITEEEYNEGKKKMKPFDVSLLQKYEISGDSELDGSDGCDTGACPIR